MPDNISKCIHLLSEQIKATLPRLYLVEDKGLYSLTTHLQLDQLPTIPQLPPPFLVWGRPDHNHYRIGLGTALQFETHGKGRFQQLQHDFKSVCGHWQHYSLTGQPYQPGAFCAFAFDEDDTMTGPWQGIANSLITIPEVLLEFSEGQYTLTLSCQSHRLQSRQSQIDTWLERTSSLLASISGLQPDNEKPNSLYRAPNNPLDSDWLELVKNAKETIHTKRLSKVVPARHIRIHASHPFNETAILKRLAKSYPSCLLLGMSLANKILIAATPERLVALNNGTISCDALGGTGECSGDAQQDNLRAHALLQDTKTRHEHALIVDHLRHRLDSVSAHISVPDTPSIFPLGHLQHLWTPIKAQCKPGISLFDLAASLHPTPAVAGSPTATSRRWIAENETFNRGWYSGCVGWIQADGNGELAVLLRAALLSGNAADLYAGAGIVADSDPQAELAETELKLNTIIDALCKQHDNDEEQQKAQR